MFRKHATRFPNKSSHPTVKKQRNSESDALPNGMAVGVETASAPGREWAEGRFMVALDGSGHENPKSLPLSCTKKCHHHIKRKRGKKFVRHQPEATMPNWDLVVESLTAMPAHELQNRRKLLAIRILFGTFLPPHLFEGLRYAIRLLFCDYLSSMIY